MSNLDKCYDCENDLTGLVFKCYFCRDGKLRCRDCASAHQCPEQDAEDSTEEEEDND